MGKVSDSLRGMIEENAKGGVFQYSTGLPKLQGFIDGVRKSNMLLIGGKSGSGKTSFVLNNYVYHPLKRCVEEGSRDLDIIIFCLELTKELTLSKLVTSYLFDKFGTEMSMKEMLSFNGPMSKASMEMLDTAWPFIEKLEERITFIDGKLDSNTLVESMGKYYEGKGVFRGKDGKLIRDARGLGDNNTIEFVPNNPKLITLGIMDHIGEVTPMTGKTRKQEIDDVADKCKMMRNVCGTSWCILQQINRAVSNVGRRDRYAGLELDDFKDSGNVAEKSDSVLGLYYPYGMKDMKAAGYDVGRMKQRLKIAQVLKSRWGASEVGIGLAFYGQCNTFAEMPKADHISNYDMYMTPSWIREKQNITNDLENEI